MIREISNLLPRVDFALIAWNAGEYDRAEDTLRRALIETADANRVHRLTRELHETIARVSSLKVSSRWVA